MNKPSLRTLAAALAIAASLGAQAHPTPSDASAVSMLPIAVSVAAPVALLSAGAVLTVVSVEAWPSARSGSSSAHRTARGRAFSSGRAGRDLSVAAGTAVTVTAISTGWVLSSASEAIAFIPNQIGAALLHNERITR